LSGGAVTGAVGPSSSGGVATGSSGTSGPGAAGSSGLGGLAASVNQLTGVNCSPASGSLVTIGNLGTYSGVIGAIPQQAQGALYVWANYLNSCGGLDGHRVKVISQDDGGDPSVAISEEQQMVQQDHVLAFVGDFVPTTGQQADTYLEQAKVPEIGGDGVNPIYYTGAMWFPVTTQIDLLALDAVKLAVKAGKTQLANFYCVEVPTVCSQLDTYVHDHAQSVGATDVLDAGVSLTQPSFAAQCQQARSRGATVIMTFTDSASLKRAADDCANSLNYHPQWITISLAANTILQSDPDMQNLMIPVGSFTWVDNSTPAEQLYHSQMAKYAPSEPQNATTSEVWASAMLTTMAARGHLGANPSSASLLQGLYAVQGNNLGGLTPPLSFHGGGPPTPISCYFAAQVIAYKWSAPAGNTLQC
jgi:branched-chain amino acid transport system substrate-binding protein